MGRGTRWFLFGLGCLIAFIGFWMVVGGLVAGGAAAPGESSSGIVVAIVGIAFLVAGLMLCRAMSPTVTAVIGALCVLPAVVGAATCVLTAVVFGRADPADLDPDAAARYAWIGAAICAAIAVAASLNWWQWLRRRGSHATVHHLKQLLAVGYGSLLFCEGLGAGLFAAIGMLRDAGLGRTDLSNLYGTVALAGSAALSLGAGTLLVWHGASSLTGVSSQPLRLPSPWAPLLGALAAIGLGAVLLQSDSAVGLMPLAHAAAVVLPGLAILVLAARGSRHLPAAARATWRELLTMVAYGSAVAATIAGIVNSLAFVGAIVAFMTARGAFDGVSTYREFSDAFSNIGDYLSKSDQVLLLLGVIAVLGPLNEEFWKGFGVRLMRDTRPTRYQAFLFGVAAGVGFGAVEANIYGAGAFNSSPYRWWDGVLLRGGASSLHALASGTVGLGWYYFFAGRRGRALAHYLLAVGLHGTWNAINVLAAARVVPWLKDISDHNLEIGLEVAVGVLAAGVLYMLWRLSASLAEEELRDLRLPAPAAMFVPSAPSAPSPLSGGP